MSTTETSYRHTPEMGEISGFGGDYETCCQDMLEAGVNWLNAHPDADLKIASLQNVYGVVFTEGAARQLEDVVATAADGEATGAMVHTILQRLFFIRHNGWERYCRELLDADHA